MNHYNCLKHFYKGSAPCSECVIEESRLQMQAITKSIPGCIGALTHSESQKTLRDEFAMSAMSSLISVSHEESRRSGGAAPYNLLRRSYEYADAAMKAREAQS